MWTIFKDLIEFVTVLLLFYVWVSCPCVTWHICSRARDGTHIPWIEEPVGLQSMGSQELDTTYRLNHHQVNIVLDRVNTICFGYYAVIIIVAVTVKY